MHFIHSRVEVRETFADRAAQHLLMVSPTGPPSSSLSYFTVKTDEPSDHPVSRTQCGWIDRYDRWMDRQTTGGQTDRQIYMETISTQYV